MMIPAVEKFARDAGVEIRTNTEVTKEYAEKEAPDALIVACGSAPLISPLPGLDGDAERVSTITNVVYREYLAAMDI